MQLDCQMMKMDAVEATNGDVDLNYVDPDQLFKQRVQDFIVFPFGKKLNQEILTIFQQLDLPESFLADLKRVNSIEPRKTSRKPCTPSRIEKEQITFSQNPVLAYLSGKRSTSRPSAHKVDSASQTDLSMP